MKANYSMINFSNYTNKSIKKIAINFFSKINKGSLTVTFPDNTTKSFKGFGQGYKAQIKLNNYKLFFKLFHKGSIGFAESYMNGDFESTNLLNLLLFSYDNQNNFLNNKNVKGLFHFYFKFRHYLNENTKSKSKKNISFHYDLGNNFYKLWLDSSMTYSSAIFSNRNIELYDAQINKYEQIAKPLKLNENSQVLEIGCGWGGFASYAAKNFGSNVTAITISKEQYEFATKRIFKEGLNDKVCIEMKDYRDVKEKYNNIVSIEMFEAVGKKYWDIFLDIIKQSLHNEGLASLQIITIDDAKAKFYQSNPDFIQKYIFPGGILPSKNQLKKINIQLGLSFNEIASYKNSYVKTLAAWNEKFQNSWPIIASQGFNLRFKKMWEFYFFYCQAGFISGNTDVSQFIIKK